MATATRISDAAFSSDSLEGSNSSGLQARVLYIVPTPNQVEAYNADGLPAFNSSLDASLPQLIHRRRVVEYVAGRDPSRPGISRVACIYETANWGSSKAPPPSIVGSPWTELVPQTDTVLLRAGINGLLLEGGDGVQVNYGWTLARVHVAYATSGAGVVDWARMMALQAAQNVNQDPLSLPPIYRYGPTISRPPSGAQYLGFETSLENELFEVVHILKLGEELDIYTSVRIAPDGTVGGETAEQIYAAADLGGLW